MAGRRSAAVTRIGSARFAGASAAGKRLAETASRAGAAVRRAVDRLGTVARAVRGGGRLRVSLQTRLLLVFFALASASTIMSLGLQQRSLSADLQRLVRGRLERATSMLGQLVDQHLTAQLERYRAISSTPQFLANVEAGHRPTLSHFVEEIATSHGAEVVMFVGPGGDELAGAGDAVLREDALARLRDARSGRRARAVTALVERDGVPYALTSVPLRQGSRVLGSLAALEPLGTERLSAWSKLCRTRVSLQPAGREEASSMAALPVGERHLHVSTSFEAERTAQLNARSNLITGGLLGIALALAASMFLARSLVRPIRAIQAATERIGAGDLRVRVDDRRGDEVGDVARALNLMLERLEQNISHRIRAEQKVSHLAYHDGLTGLGNRRMLEERLGAALEATSEHGEGVAVILLDLDRFKEVNDTLGHTAGDELLMEVARRLTSCVWSSGIPGPGEDAAVLTRLGGDEFTLVLTGVGEREQIERVADGVLAALGTPFDLRGREVTLGASLGIATSPEDARDVETLLRASDMAMFHAKSRGGRSYEFYADSMEKISARRLALENKLQRALENDEFDVLYQPKVDLDTNRVAGVEALLRWRDPQHGSVGPDQFVPMAEETGAIVPIGEWVLRSAIEQVLRWQREGLPPLRVAVNVSVRQIEHRVDFAQTVARVLEDTGLEPRLLDLEITEGALLRDAGATIALLERLRGMGVGLSLDDFGTGYSSLSYLRQLPIDTLKIDRSFIRGADASLEDAALVGCIVAMAKVIGLRVVVEGVETRSQHRFLRGLGCDEIQGFLVSGPVPADEVAAIVRKRNRTRSKKKRRQASC